MNREITRLIKRLRLGRAIESYPVTVTSATHAGTRVQFCTNLERDPVQRKHRKGAFYEVKELEALAAHFPIGGTFVDIGAHAGNHSLFAAMFMGADKVIPVEPYAPGYRLLVQNMLVNGVLDRVDFSKLGCAVGAQTAEGCTMKSGRRNPAAARVKMGAKDGDVSMLRADMLLADVTPDMIKIDVCGMEMDVLAGLSGVFARCNPALMIEVSAAQDAAFNDWTKQAGYKVVTATKRNKNDLNYLLTHKDAIKVKAPAKKTTATKASATKAATKKTTTKAKPTTAKKTTTAKKVTTKAKPKTTTAKPRSTKTT